MFREGRQGSYKGFRLKGSCLEHLEEVSRKGSFQDSFKVSYKGSYEG